MSPGARRPRQDNAPPAPPAVPPPPPPTLADDVTMALRFFSRLPTGDRPHEMPDLRRIAPALPFAGILIGLGPALLLMLGLWVGLPPLFAAALAVAAMVVVSGGMAEDALADSADGLFGGSTVERRLEIMKDSRHGTYGVAALCLFLVLRVAALGGIGAINPLAAGGIWLGATILSRSAALFVALDLPAARQGGAAASVGPVTKASFLIGCGFAALLLFVFAAPFASILGVVLTLAAAAGVVLGWTLLCRRLVGGQTGDLIGAAQALCEIAALSVLMIFA